MEWLRRNAAPLSQKVWAEIDDIALSMFKQTVVARRIADFDGPRGWDHVATQLGTFKSAQAPKHSGKARRCCHGVVLQTAAKGERVETVQGEAAAGPATASRPSRIMAPSPCGEDPS